MGRIGDINLVEDFRQFRPQLPGMVDGMPDGPELGQSHELCLHETTGGLFLIGETAFKLSPVNGGEVFKDALAAVILKVIQNGRRII